jgi:hypothetical protein
MILDSFIPLGFLSWHPDARRALASYSIAPYASVRKSVNMFGDSDESIMHCAKRTPIHTG